jgi:diguanylate cyclase (GGDEF)-like protein
MPNYLYLRILKLIIFLVLTTAFIILVAVWQSTSKTVHKNIYGSLNYVKSATQGHLEKISESNNEVFSVALNKDLNAAQMNTIKDQLAIDVLIFKTEEGLDLLSDAFTALTSIEVNLIELNQDTTYFFLNKNEQLYFFNHVKLKQTNTKIYHGYVVDKAWLTNLAELSGLNLSLVINEQSAPSITTLEDQLVSTQILKKGIVSDSYFDLFNPSVIFGLQPLFTSEFVLKDVIGEPASMFLSINAERVSNNFLKLQTTIAVVAFISVVIASFFGFLTSKKITKPIESLTKYAKRIAKGDYRAHITPENLSTEFQSLFNTFDTMKQNIEQRESEILYRSLHDSVTPLHNREFIKSFVSTKFEQTLEFQVINIHILNFREINDVFGNEFGDACLLRFANRLLALSGKSARFTGAEFLWFPDSDNDESQLKELKLSLEKPFVENGINIRLQIAIAQLKCPVDAQNQEQFFKRLAILSDTSKNEPNAIQSFSVDVEKEYLHKLSLVSELSHEIDINCQNCNIVYQPYKGLHQQTRYRAEALLRWHSQKLGNIGPDVFIPLAEEIGVINQITKWVITTVVKDIKCLKQQNIECEISINISSQDLFDEEFITLLEQINEDTEIDNASISFELTESVLVNDVDTARQLMESIKRLGFKLALDDFGTGYSSLAYLSTLPVDTIKLDHAFVKDLSVSLDKRTLSKRIMQIAADYNMELVAEGVEDKDSLAYLMDQSCEWAQGFYMSKPLALEDITRYFQHQSDKNL